MPATGHRPFLRNFFSRRKSGTVVGRCGIDEISERSKSCIASLPSCLVPRSRTAQSIHSSMRHRIQNNCSCSPILGGGAKRSCRNFVLRPRKADLCRGRLEPPSDHPGIGAGADHPLAEGRVINLAVAHRANKRQNMANFMRIMGKQPFAEKIAQFERQPQHHIAGFARARRIGAVEDGLELMIGEAGDDRARPSRSSECRLRPAPGWWRAAAPASPRAAPCAAPARDRASSRRARL